MDRPPGHIYFLACPLDLQLEEGDTEPLFCTMALYSLPPQQQHEEKIAEDNSPTDPDRTTFFDSVFRGKISEDFFFPAGDWNSIEGFEREGGCQKYVDHDDEERPQQSWRRRKRRAIMSFDPLDISPSDLHLVIQVYRTSRPSNENERSKSTNGNKRSLFSGKLMSSKAKSRDKHASTASIKSITTGAFEEVGAQYLVPMCFSITPVFSAQNITQQKVASTSLYSFPDEPQSNEDFVKLLASISNLSTFTEAKPSPITCGSTDLLTSYLGR